MAFVGRYEILGLLGKGGMGVVYKARLPMVGRIVAVKLLKPEETLEMLLGGDELEQRFLAEVSRLGAVRHEHICQVLDFDRDREGRPFYVMEYYCLNLGVVIGERFESEHPTRRLDAPRAAAYADQILDALARLHYDGLLHQDLKPFNVMLTGRDTVKLIDFGMAAAKGEAQNNPPNLKIGTPFYTAPEQEEDPRAASERSDLFSVGVMLWRMLTGTMVPEPLGSGARASRFAPELGEAFDEFLATATHPEPHLRFASAGKMRVALADCLADWQREAEAACALEEAVPAKGPAARAMRSAPVKARAGQAREILPLDELWQPTIPASSGLEDRGETVYDPATGLFWQQRGSQYPLAWDETGDYAEAVNAAGFAGFDDWRLPTVEELSTLLTPPSVPGAHCLALPFDRSRRWLWSADRKSFTAAWFADVRLGFFHWQDFTCRFHARLVRGGRS